LAIRGQILGEEVGVVNIKSQKDFFSGLLFMAVGMAFAWGATSYPVGSGDRMGPGYFPLVLGVLLAVLGGMVVFKALVVETEDGETIGQWRWRPLGCIVAANLAFGVLVGGLPGLGLPSMGMMPAIFVLTLVSAGAASTFKLWEVLVLASVLSLGSYGVLIKLLKLPLQVWPAFLGW
jgi:hypothetical protein